MLRSEHEAQGSQAPPVVGLSAARWIIDGVRIRDGDGRRLPGTAIGIVGGRVAAMGTVASVRRRVGPTAEPLTFRGATALPGLVDPHVHLGGMATREIELDCGSAGSIAELLRAVRASARRTPRGDWIRGAGLDEARLGRLPTAAELEGAAPGVPVRLRHRSRHASVVSTTGLRRLGGVLPRRAIAESGLVAGREDVVARVVGPVGDDAFVAGLRAVGTTLVERGVTCIGDASPRSGRAAARLAAALGAAEFAPRVLGMGTATGAPWPDDPRLGFAGVKIVVEDDAAGMRPGPATLRRLVRAAAMRGLRVSVHCVSLGTLAAALEAFAAVPPAHRRRRGHRLEHLAECPPELLGALARLEVAVVSNPSFLPARGDVYLAERSVPSSWLYPLRSVARAGIAVAAASDAPVTPCDPWATMAAARERRTERGVVVGASERVGARMALTLVCRDAAAVVGRPDLGRLAPGGVADVVVVDRDPVTASAAAVRRSRVLCTVIAGRVVSRR